MDFLTVFLTLVVLVSWGIGSFIAKLAASKIGERSVFVVLGFLFLKEDISLVKTVGVLFALVSVYLLSV